MLRVTLLFVAGFTAVFVALGAGATALGEALRANLAVATRLAGWVVLGFGVLLIVLSLSSSPRFRVRDPGTAGRDPTRTPRGVGSSADGTGVRLRMDPLHRPGARCDPHHCRPAAERGEGMLLLLVYGLGLGVPFVLAGMGLSRALGAARWLRGHSRGIGVFSGVALAGFGLLMITGGLSVIAGWVTDFFLNTPLARIIESI